MKQWFILSTPLDIEIVARALDDACHAVQQRAGSVDFESDEEWEGALQEALIEIARFNGLSDPEALKDILATKGSHITQVTR